jgi:CRP/FNR family transcriptional regulator, cyclic AMP receptor protein
MESMHDSRTCGRQVRPPGDFFNKLSPAAVDDLTSMQVLSDHEAYEVLFSEKEKPRGMFVVLQGEVRLSISSSDGRRLSLKIARVGDILGLASALSNTPYDVTAETIYPVKLSHIGRTQFLAFLARRPEAYQVVIEELSRNFSTACEQLRTVGLAATAPEKLARFLLEWSEGHSGSCRVRFSLPHEEIGEFIGASRETVTRTMSTFKHRRLVAFQGSMLTIPSRAALEDYAHA